MKIKRKLTMYIWDGILSKENKLNRIIENLTADQELMVQFEKRHDDAIATNKSTKNKKRKNKF